jgi:hypothetical protein
MRENLKKLSLFIFGSLFPLYVFAECATPAERAKIGLEMDDAKEIDFFTKRFSAAGMAEYNKKMATPFSGKTTCPNSEQGVAPNSWKSKPAQDCIGALYAGMVCINDNKIKEKEFTEEPATVTTTTKSYTVTYALDGGMLDGKTGTITQTCEDGETISLKSAPTKTGSVFAGWKYPNEEIVDAGFSNVSCGEYTLTAQWKSSSDLSSTTESKDFRKKSCEDSGGSYMPTDTISDIDDNCSCPNGMIVTSGSIGNYLSLKTCSKCSDGWEPDPDKQNKFCREKSVSTDASQSDKKTETKKSLSDMAETPDEKKLVSEFDELNKQFESKVKQLTSAK